MLLFGGLGGDQDEALRLILYAGDNRVLARNADLLTDFGRWRILVPFTIVASLYLAFTRLLRAPPLLFTVFRCPLLLEFMKFFFNRVLLASLHISAPAHLSALPLQHLPHTTF